jgi:hypothetical protein
MQSKTNKQAFEVIIKKQLSDTYLEDLNTQNVSLNAAQDIITQNKSEKSNHPSNP